MVHPEPPLCVRRCVNFDLRRLSAWGVGLCAGWIEGARERGYAGWGGLAGIESASGGGVTCSSHRGCCASGELRLEGLFLLESPLRYVVTVTAFKSLTRSAGTSGIAGRYLISRVTLVIDWIFMLSASLHCHLLE